MTPERWQRITDLFHTSLESDVAGRDALLAGACAGDEELRIEVEAMLKAHEGAGNAMALLDQSWAGDDTLLREIEGTAATPIGPYELVRQLGEGGMGVVYHAQQLRPIRRDVALKIIKPGMDSKQVIARFETERQALAVMDHANIARVFDAGATVTGRPYFVMELVDGVPITRYCDSKRLTLRERIALFIPVCQAIQHAHQKGIIHRDIKPSNVLVAEADGKPLPKVIDFGLAKALEHQLSDASMTTNLGMVVGTLEYMSPEQSELGRHDIDARSDIYSLGVVLYELLTGTTPLEHEPLANAAYLEVLERIRDEEPPAPSARLRRSATLPDAAALRRSDPARLPKLLHGELDWIAMKALEKDRTQRYETVNGLARDLGRYLKGEPVEAAPPSTTYRLGKIVRKHRVWLATAAAFAALLVAGVVVSSWMAVKASRAERVAQAVNDFLQNDVLAQASANQQAAPGTKPDPDLKVRAALDRAAARIEGKFSAQPQVEAAIRQTIGNTYKDLGLYQEAQGQVESAIELRRLALGEEHPDTLSSMSSLTEILYMRGQYAQLETLSAKLLAVRRRVLGDQHSDTALTLNNLGVAYIMQGKYAQADALHTKALEVQRRVLGEDHKDTLNTMSNLASLYLRQGNNAQAETFFSKVLEARRRVQGEEDPDTLIGMNNLALAYSRQGKYAQAEPLYTKVLEIQRRVLGEEHSATLTSMNNVAQLYRSQGKYAEEEILRSKVLEAYRRALGEDHPTTLSITTSLATLYTIQGKYAQAEALLTKALATGRRVQGEENPTTLVTKYRLADLYRNQGMYGPAAALLATVVESRRRVLGEEHPDTLITLLTLGHVRLLQQNYIEAGTTLRDALNVYEKARPDTWQRYDCQSLLGASLAGERKYDEAEPLLLSGYEGMIQRESTMSASDREMVKEAGNSIVKLYQSWGKPEKAAEWRQRLQQAQPASRPK